ncbi:retrieval of early ER protein Rer1 [Yamadazyma tenuis ATCC 10573]|uniref:Protein RER1 n=2 Tax=Candida tenuis TaxID=2315449 RepID=G3AWM2_CANTC|nr:retrieval of early ER protein Rer1 [Yamadazyma tenuis ATCC 10573]EGV66569.1 retrieval of early ER protein Rer1 [Yamadazyma tenuis ATCC 10573]
MENVLDQVKDTKVYQEYQKLGVTYQKLIDQSVPHKYYRWGLFGGVLFIFMVRILVSQGWYIICYALGIYLLNMLLAFLTPKFDPSLEQERRSESIEEGLGEDDDPAENEEEFRPFIRRLPEFKFWYNSTRAVILALITSFFSIFDIPVFWPILLMYFIILFTLTMRKQIQHMIKYKYLPFDFGKAKYKPRT